MSEREAIRLVEPLMEQEADVKAFLDECARADKGEFNGVGGLDQYEDYGEWLAFNSAMKVKAVRPDWVAGSTYFSVRESDGIIVGMLNLRHELNQNLLKTGGHIGYCVRPSERKKGYGSEMLRLALVICRDMGIDLVLVTCNETNYGSRKVIENNGGVLENTVLDHSDGHMTRRYWIRLNG